jgi:tetratricopeptide (TPR) repeat protein
MQKAAKNAGKESFEKGREAYAAGDFAKALECFERALKEKPDSIGALCNKGAALYSLGDCKMKMGDTEGAGECFRKAIASYGQVLRLDPKDADALEGRRKTAQKLAEVFQKAAQSD